MTEIVVRRATPMDSSALPELLAEADELHRRALPWLFRQVEFNGATRAFWASLGFEPLSQRLVRHADTAS